MPGTNACSLSDRARWEKVRRYVVYPLRLRRMSLQAILEKKPLRVGEVIFGGGIQ
jgi:hypothetical protein